MDNNQLRKYIIQPVQKSLGLYSQAAENLTVLTIAVESAEGKYVHQLGNGPACGICQMEPRTHDDIWNSFLRYHSDGDMGNGETIRQYLSRLGSPTVANLAGKVRGWQVPGLYDDNNALEMVGNNFYAVAMCRIHYLRVPKPLPQADDIDGLAAYWKRHYNTPSGAGRAEKAAQLYREFVQ